MQRPIPTGVSAAKSLGGGAQAAPTERNVKVTIRLRNLKEKGFSPHKEIPCSTVADVAKYAEKVLSSSWRDLRFKYDPKFWIVGRLRGGDPVKQKDLGVSVRKKMVYTVYEYWTKLPKEVVRDCVPDDTLFTVFTNPDHRSPFTMLSALCLGTMKKGEYEHPFCVAGSRPEATKLCGLSVRLVDNSIQAPTAVAPLRDIGKDEEEEKIGRTHMTPEQLMSLIPENEEQDGLFGILRNSLLFDGENYPLYPRSCRTRKKPKGETNPDFVSRREVNWSSALEEGLDVESLGFLCFFDNEGFIGHGTLARTSDTTADTPWAPAFQLRSYGPFMPLAAANSYNQGHGEDLDVVLKSEAFQPNATDQEPVVCENRAFNHHVPHIRCHPKLCQYFKLKHLSMTASAEPQPLKQFRDDRQVQFYNSLVTLFYQPPFSLETIHLIETAEEKEYKVEELDDVEIWRLKEAFEYALSEIYGDHREKEEEEVVEQLEEGMSILSELKR